MTSTAQTNIPINITSFNVNGLGQDTKRLAIVNKLKKDNGVILLQETHSIALSEKRKNEWGVGDKSYFHMGPQTVEVFPLFFCQI